MPRMKLDVKDRLMLANQYLILEALYPDEAEHFASNRQIVESGYEIQYDAIVEQIDPKPMSEAECRKVYDTLDMFRRLKHAYDELPDKTGIEARDIRFLGYDGNNETSYLGFHEFLTKQRRWTETPAMNSHMPTLDLYDRMLAAYAPFHHNENLTKADIQTVIAARTHPDNRR